MSSYWMSNTIKALVGGIFFVVGYRTYNILSWKFSRTKPLNTYVKEEDYGVPVSPV